MIDKVHLGCDINNKKPYQNINIYHTLYCVVIEFWGEEKLRNFTMLNYIIYMPAYEITICMI